MRNVALLLGAASIAAVVVASCKSSSSGGAEPANGPFGADVPVREYVHVDHLAGPVDVVRDQHGMIHVYATSLADAARVEGYMMARDRTVQLEIYRRVAEGRMAEAFGDLSPSLIDDDIAMRTIGLHRAAKAMYAQYPDGSELKTTLDAFADGISQFNARVQSGDERLPRDVLGFSKALLEPWTGVDALAIARLQTQNLAYSADSEIALQGFVDAARAAFPAGSADPLEAKRSGFLVDFVRFAPIDPTTPLDGLPNDATHTLRATGAATDPRARRTPRVEAPLPPSVRLDPSLLAATRAWSDATKRVLRIVGAPPWRGSNDWVVAPSRSATGHALLANDPHLSLSAPSVFYMVHLNVTGAGDADVNVEGMAFPGIPGVVLGFNDRLAWGATTADYDVSDVFHEQLTPDGKAVMFKGQAVPLQTVHEPIAVAGGGTVAYDVLVVPHHGPIVPTIVNHAVVPPDPSKGALSIEWTGMQPTDELGAFVGYMRAKNVEDARAAVRKMGVGAQNFVFADVDGDIFYSTQSRIPVRDKRAFTWDPKTFQGTLPCLVLPGDGTAEWTGDFVDEAYVPHVKNPKKGYLATANGDQFGGTLDDDPSNDLLPNGQPQYFACWHDPGWRVGRIVQRIEGAGHPLTIDDLASIQADARSNVGALLAPKLLDALAHAEEEKATAGAHADLTAVVKSARYQAAPIAELRDLLAKWGAESDYDAAAGVSLDDGSPSSDPKEARASQATLLFDAWLVQMYARVFDDELNHAHSFFPPDPPGARRSLAWLLTADPKQLATYDAATNDSALFDDMTTPNVVESRDERAVTALLDVLDFLTAKLGANRDAWRWGTLHTVRFASLVPLWGSLSIPPAGDAKFPNGFPRHGDGDNVDVGGYDDRPDALANVNFAYAHGPVQRLVVDLDPKGPIARDVIPGGEVWNTTSPHFADEAELWRRNQNHPMPLAKPDVVTAAEEHLVFTTGASREVAP